MDLYQNNKNKEDSLFVKIDRQLKKHRRILKLCTKAGKATVRKETLIYEEFGPKCFTHYWGNNKGDTYLFCYEFGSLASEEKGKQKYVLVKWPNYMQTFSNL